MTPPDPVIHLSNPMRYLVPIGTALLALVMFIPPIVLVHASNTRTFAGVLMLVGIVLWLIRSAWRAPFEMTIQSAGLAVRRWSGDRHYTLKRVRKWWFAVPDGPPTKVAPATNGVLYVVLDDRTRFRAEVTADEATRIATILPAP